MIRVFVTFCVWRMGFDNGRGQWAWSMGVVSMGVVSVGVVSVGVVSVAVVSVRG